MLRRRVRFFRIAAVLVVALGGAGTAMAQPQESATIDVRGGMAVPFGTLSENLESGLSLGAGFGVPVSARLAVRLDVDLNLLRGDNDIVTEVVVEAPDLDVVHVLGGLSYRLTNPGSDYFVDVYGGAGIGRQSVDDLDAEIDFDFALALKLGRRIGNRSALGVRAKLHDLSGDFRPGSIGQVQAVYQLEL